MPLYEYQCDACGHQFEQIQKFSDPLADTCPKCGGKVRKLLSSPAIQFKGSGWYITDYAKKSGTDGGKADKTSESSSSDSKPSGESKSGDSSSSSSPSSSTTSTTKAE